MNTDTILLTTGEPVTVIATGIHGTAMTIIRDAGGQVRRVNPLIVDDGVKSFFAPHGDDSLDWLP